MAERAEKERAIVKAAKAALRKKREEAEALAEAEAIVAADDARIAEEARLAKRAELLEEFDRRAARYVELRDAAVGTMERYSAEARAAYEARAEMNGLMPSIEAYSVEGEQMPTRPGKVSQLFAAVGSGQEGEALRARHEAEGIRMADARLDF
jgi:hypothetical protein